MPGTPGRGTTITIDNVIYSVDTDPLTGAKLRQIASIGPERDLYLEQPGLAEDRLIDDAAPVAIKDSLRFFSAPRTIVMGSHGWWVILDE